MARHHHPRCCCISSSRIIGHTPAVVLVARDSKERPTMPRHLRPHSHYLGSRAPRCVAAVVAANRKGQGMANNAEAPSSALLLFLRCCHCHYHVSGQGITVNGGKAPSSTCRRCPRAPSSALRFELSSGRAVKPSSPVEPTLVCPAIEPSSCRVVKRSGLQAVELLSCQAVELSSHQAVKRSSCQAVKLLSC
jgi:hypothetical protein